MVRRRRTGKESLPLTLGVTLVAAVLAGLFLATSLLATRSGAFYIGYCGPVWVNYSGDGMIHWNKEPVFFTAMVSVFSFLGLTCLGIALLGGRQLIFWRKRTGGVHPLR